MGGSFNPARDILDLSGKVMIVTGGNSGLGAATITHYAAHNPAKIYMGARPRAKAMEAITRIKANHPNANIEFLEVDLASFDSIKKAAARVNQEESRLDVLQANGGVCVPPYAVTKEGFEIQTGTNYVGQRCSSSFSCRNC